MLHKYKQKPDALNYKHENWKWMTCNSRLLKQVKEKLLQYCDGVVLKIYLYHKFQWP